MKKFSRFLAIATLFMMPLCANASPVDLTLYWSAKTGTVSFDSNRTTGNYYLDYDVKLDGGVEDEAFCVENAAAANDKLPHPYTLLSIDSSLSNYGLEPNRYFAAVAIAQYYYSTYEASQQYSSSGSDDSYASAAEESWKAAAQIAIWEVIFDGTGTSFKLNDGFFRTSSYSSQAVSIWTEVIKKPFPTYSEDWSLAVSPIITASNPYVTTDPFQNYLVRYHHSVPEPASLLLLGLGLVGLAGIRRKIK